MQISDAIRVIKERISIVDIIRRYVDLKQNGQRFVGCCPFHQETKPSFSVSPDKGTYYCFGCHATGDIFEFHSKINGLEFKESLEQLANEAGIELEYGNRKTPGSTSKDKNRDHSIKQSMLQMHEAAASHFTKNLISANGKKCSEYLETRGISREIRERFGLGWAHDDWQNLFSSFSEAGFNPETAYQAGLLGKSATGRYYDRFRGRLIFPIKNLANQIIAFGGRIIDDSDEAKYINSADTPIYKKKEHLYGLAQARAGIASRGFAILTEGYMDVLTLHQFGYDNGIGVLGTSLTVEQIKRISGFTSKLLLVFDGDRAGRKAALRSSEMILSRGLACNVAVLPEEEDIDSLLRKAGPDSFREICSNAPDGLSFCISVMKTLSPREAVEWAKSFLASITIPELTTRFASEIAQKLGISEAELRKNLSSSAVRASSTIQHLQNMRDQQILIFAVRYPERMEDLRTLGADTAITSTRAKQLWDILEQWGKDEVLFHMDEKQKSFWHIHRGPGSPPLTNGDTELQSLEKELTAYYSAYHKACLSAAMAEQENKHDFETDLEYLKALQQTMEKSREQS